MTEASIVSELLLKLYRLSGESPIDEFQDAALRLLKGSLAFDSSMWGTATTTPVGIEIHTLHLTEQGQEMLSAYEALKQHDTVAKSVFGHRQITRRFHSKTQFGCRSEREFREFQRRFGIENMLVTSANDTQSNFMEWMSLFRAKEEAHCRAEEQLLLDQLSPHLMQALSFNRARHLQVLGRREGLLHRPGAVADLHGRIYQSEPGFDAMLHREWVDWGARQLPARVLEGLRSGQAEHAGRSLVLRARVEHGLLFLRARPLCKADKLSARERAIANLATKGCTHKEIAQTLARSPATIRNQMQTIYDKLEVGNVAQLIDELMHAD